MDSVRIEGEMQKPQVAYIIPRASQIDLSGDLQRLRPQQTARYLQLVRNREVTFGRQATVRQ